MCPQSGCNLCQDWITGFATPGCVIKLKPCKLPHFYVVFRRAELKEWLSITEFPNFTPHHRFQAHSPHASISPTFVSLITNLFTSHSSTSDTSMKFGVWKFSMDMSRGYPSALIISVKSEKWGRAGIPSYISSKGFAKIVIPPRVLLSYHEI